MNFTKSSETGLVQSQLTAHLNTQFKAFAAEISPLVQASIKVERIGFTRNASNTPHALHSLSSESY